MLTQEKNYHEIGDYIDATGEVTIKGAVWQVCEQRTLVGINGQLLSKPGEHAFPLESFDDEGEVVRAYLTTWSGCTMILYRIQALPICAHFGIYANDMGDRVITHVTQDLKAPIGRAIAKNDQYEFYLALGLPGQISSIFLVRHIKSNTFFCTGLPNTWDDGRACLGADLDAKIAKAGIWAIKENFKSWKASAYNNHLRKELTQTLMRFWAWDEKGDWIPNYDARGYKAPAEWVQKLSMLPP